jgi:hypothetical protein
MNKKIALSLTALLLLAIYYFATSKKPSTVIAGTSVQPSKSTPSAASARPQKIFPSDSNTALPSEETRSAFLETTQRPATLEARNQVEQVALLIRDFRNALHQNPIGDNQEITASLLGKNQKQISFVIPVGSIVNEKKELCDNWGAPYFFHQLSASVMEIRSAGEDKTLWTADDIVER